MILDWIRYRNSGCSYLQHESRMQKHRVEFRCCFFLIFLVAVVCFLCSHKTWIVLQLLWSIIENWLVCVRAGRNSNEKCSLSRNSDYEYMVLLLCLRRTLSWEFCWNNKNRFANTSKSVFSLGDIKQILQTRPHLLMKRLLNLKGVTSAQTDS